MIRPITRADRDAVRELLRATGNFKPDELDIADELMDAVLDRPEQRDYHAFVGDVAATPAGVLILGPVPATVGTWHLYWIAVHPSHYGSDAARELADFAETFVRERDGYLIVAETSSVRAYARARAFYVKHGYELVAQVTDYYRPGDDLVLFVKRLESRS